MAKKILIIDDELLVQKVLTDKLQEQGFEIISALDGEEGLKMIENKKPDLILLDIIMPKLDGTSVLKKLKENPETNRIPVLIFTNLSDKETLAISLKFGGVEYLTKADHTLDDIVEKVKEKLGP